MSSHPPTSEELLLHDLMDGLSISGRQSAVSVGVVGHAIRTSRPPTQCLRTCLAGDPDALASRGCPFLLAAARNDIDPASLRDGCCPKGFRVAAQHITVGGGPAVLLTVQGQPISALSDGADADARELLDRQDARIDRQDATIDRQDATIDRQDATIDRQDADAPLAVAARLVERISRVLEENAGFAEEVLKNYEQLNLIFDLTQQIAQVTDARVIEKLLLHRVARLLAVAEVCVVTTDGQCRAYTAEGGVCRDLSSRLRFNPLDLTDTIDVVRGRRQVHVCSVAAQPVIAGPLVRLDDQVDVVLAVRRAGGEMFSSGQMMLTESVLTFGGQIIRNTELHERMRRMLLEVTRAMVAAIDKKDHYTSGHSERVGFLTRLTGHELGLRSAELQIMEWAGLLHDIGKIGIPEEILCKPGKLTEEEYEVVKQHPRMGYEILRPIASFELVLEGLLHHHEQPNGSGYPEGLVGDQIPLVARIIHVADTFDALTSTRSYRQAFSVARALQIIREEQGTRIDAEVAEAFFRAFEAYRRDDPQDFATRFPALRKPEVENALS